MGRQHAATVEFRWGAQPRLGDVVLIWRGHGLQAHRIVGASRGAWLTAGDACWRLDPPASREAVLAVASQGRSIHRALWSRVRCGLADIWRWVRR